MSTVGNFPFFGLATFGGYWNPNTNTVTGNGITVGSAAVSSALAAGALGSSVVSPAGAAVTPFTGLYFSVDTATTGSSGSSIDSLGTLNINDIVVYDANDSGDVTWVKIDYSTLLATVFMGNIGHTGFAQANPATIRTDYSIPGNQLAALHANNDSDGLIFQRVEAGASLRVGLDTNLKFKSYSNES